jgi:two-component system response regulator YesN
VQHDQLQKTVLESAPLANSGLFLRIIMNGNSELAELSHSMNDWLLKPMKGQVLVFDLDPTDEKHYSEKDKSIYRYAARNILTETLNRHKCEATVLDVRERCVAVITFEPTFPNAIAMKRVEAAANEVLENIHFFIKRKAFVGAGRFFTHVEQLHSSYQLAEQTLDNQLYWGALPWNGEGQPAKMNVSGEVYLVDERLYQAIEHGDVKMSMRYYEHLFQDLNRLRNKGLVLNTVLELVIKLAKTLRNWDAQAELPISFDSLKECSTFQSLSDQLEQLIEQTCVRIREKKALLGGGISLQAANYVQSHYHDPKLSLQLVADELQVSNSYLSRMFHKEKAIHFSDYLLMTRVEHAKKLIAEMPWLKNYEVAEKVGFIDGKYFGQVFKKYCKMTLVEYRKSGSPS